jgi:putative ABC transport system permease protein
LTVPSVGDTIVSGQNRWPVVGIFEANGGVAETEVWGDARTLQSAYRRGNTYQSVLVQLDSINAFDAFRDWLTANPQVKVGIRRESEYYAAQSAGMTRLIRSIGFGIGALMGIGAVFGAVLTMYTVVATRAREIATLRALGFNTVSVLVSILAESLAHRLLQIGMALLVYSSLDGFVIPYLGSPRIGLSVHTLSCPPQKSTELSARTMCTFLSELSARRRTFPSTLRS